MKQNKKDSPKNGIKIDRFTFVALLFAFIFLSMIISSGFFLILGSYSDSEVCEDAENNVIKEDSPESESYRPRTVYYYDSDIGGQFIKSCRYNGKSEKCSIYDTKINDIKKPLELKLLCSAFEGEYRERRGVIDYNVCYLP